MQMYRHAIVAACGFQSKNEKTIDDQLYQVTETDLALSATAEIPMAGQFANHVFKENATIPSSSSTTTTTTTTTSSGSCTSTTNTSSGSSASFPLNSPSFLPRKSVAFNHCFRTEVRGGDAQGIYRVHQFSKVEMFAVCLPEHSELIHREMIDIQIEIFSELGLFFRVLDMPTQDLGNAAHRKIDIEAWMPGKNGFGEISSTSNCTDYQSRRLNIRYKLKEDQDDVLGKDKKHKDSKAEKESVKESKESKDDDHLTTSSMPHVHTVNGTACAIPRMIISILEQFQTADGQVAIPPVLRPFMMGMEKIPSAVIRR
jgi:seryl-tRNA synthetase